MKVFYRRAVPEDASNCIMLRGKTRENAFSVEALTEIGVTVDSWGAGIGDGSTPGYIGLVEQEMVGYCFGDRRSGEIVVLALLPEYEGRGIGKTLLNLMIRELTELGFARLFLGCSANPEVRSYGFYRHLGWQPSGVLNGADDEVLEYFP